MAETFVPVHAELVVIPGPDTVTVVPVSQLQLSWMVWPKVMTLVLPLIVGFGTVTAAVTVTIAVAVVVPPVPLAVSVYVVVAVGLSV